MGSRDRRDGQGEVSRITSDAVLLDASPFLAASSAGFTPAPSSAALPAVESAPSCQPFACEPPATREHRPVPWSSRWYDPRRAPTHARFTLPSLSNAVAWLCRVLYSRTLVCGPARFSALFHRFRMLLGSRNEPKRVAKTDSCRTYL